MLKKIERNSFAFSIYDKFELEIKKINGSWEIFTVGTGALVKVNHISIPDDITEKEIPVYLDDFYHESGSADRTIKRVK